MLNSSLGHITIDRVRYWCQLAAIVSTYSKDS